METQELKEVAVSLVTSAVNARSQDSADERASMYAQDFGILMDGAQVADLYRLTSLLGDMGAMLIEMLATTLDIPADVAVQYLVQNILEQEIETYKSRDDDE